MTAWEELTISVIGTGYLGATHAACMAELGHRVIAVDVDEDKIAALSEGRLPFYEPGLSELVAKHVGSGALRFTTSFREVAPATIHFLCVGTPQRPRGDGADLSHLDSAVRSLAPFVTEKSLVVGKSTVPVGTADQVRARLRTLTGRPVEVAWNPEFLREGHAVADTVRPDRIVIGSVSAEADEAVRRCYGRITSENPDLPVVSTNYANAELVKTAANAFLATKLSFINVVADMCEAAGGDVAVVAEALGHDPRIGGQFLRAGLGFGGGCLPKDLRAFRDTAARLDVVAGADLLRQVDHVNNERRRHVVDLATEHCGGSVLGVRVAVLGAAFKPGSDDVRDSPALNVAASLHLRGAQVTVHDPQALSNARKEFPALDYAENLTDALTGASLALVLTEWEDYRGLDPAAVGALVERRVVLDARNALDRVRWTAAGWTVHTVGRSQQPHARRPHPPSPRGVGADQLGEPVGVG
ncbi:UDP-glucose/GDP-mannose dehydrogenase family protein [Lentzea sp. HUAS12]|uniref:UDP-glucose dehydrogenase family protein n=1 Tax=Lentzea sp. HUAS12 TaxID=2951806 RepID=UPI00209D7E75|nr:UDP-glucose/GDP-mannose dehydrogenase family protein [Lentzea sp. HUAS12]USX52993.1 UDP-glucose/GDP-mannose dehydrogenase family protein [Lentzea sp. HUAS12]